MTYSLATRAVRAGIDSDPTFGAVAPPLYLSANFTFDGIEALGLAAPVLCDVPKRVFADFLASATAKLLPRHLAPALRPPIPSFASQLAFNFLTA